MTATLSIAVSSAPQTPESTDAQTSLKARILVGPTASGKSAVAQFLAERDNVPVISADSMLVYRGMDIGTAKPTPEERGDVPYFGIDCVAPGEPFSTGDWLDSVFNGMRKAPACSSPVTPIVAGGTGLYVRALLSGLTASVSSPESRDKWTAYFEKNGLESLQASVKEKGAAALVADGDWQNPRRLIRALERLDAGDTDQNTWSDDPSTLPVIAGLSMPRDILWRRIDRRIAKMFEDGLVDEARKVRDEAGSLSQTACQAIGYAEALDVADGRCSIEEASKRISVRTRHLAKRQYTWLRHKLNVKWIEIDDGEDVESIAHKTEQIWNEYGAAEIRIG